MGSGDPRRSPDELLGEWGRHQAQRDKAQRLESLVFFGLLVAMVIVVTVFLSRLDARSAELNELLRAQRTEIAARPTP